MFVKYRVSTFPVASIFRRFELRKATINLVMSVCPSVRPSNRTEQLGSQRKDFHEI